MAAHAKQRAAYGLLALAVNVASQGAETVSLLAAARTDGTSARVINYLTLLDGRAAPHAIAANVS